MNYDTGIDCGLARRPPIQSTRPIIAALGNAKERPEKSTNRPPRPVLRGLKSSAEKRTAETVAGNKSAPNDKIDDLRPPDHVSLSKLGGFLFCSPQFIY